MQIFHEWTINSKRALYINLVGLWLILFTTIFMGLIIYAKYQFCDPIGISDEVKSEESVNEIKKL